MKFTLTNLIDNLFATFTKEKMPALIPVRVVTRVSPEQHR